MTPEERLAAKRANKGIEAFAAMLNNLAVGTIVAGFLSPWASGHPEPWWIAAGLICVAFVLHVVAQIALRRFLRAEE